MAIAIDASTTAIFTGTGPYTQSFTCSGTERLIAVFVAGMRNSQTTWTWSAVTFNSVALTQGPVNEEASVSSRNVRAALWTLVNPAAGAAYTLSVTPSTGLLAAVVGVVSFTGVHQTVPLGNSGTDTGFKSAFSTSITTGVSGAWLLGCGGIRNGLRTWSGGTDVVERHEGASGTSTTSDIVLFAGYRICAGAGSYAFAANADADNSGVLAALEIRPAAVATAVPVLMDHYLRQMGA